MKLAIYKHENSPQMGFVITEEEWLNKLEATLNQRVDIKWQPDSRSILLIPLQTEFGGYGVRSYDTVRNGRVFETRIAVGKMGFPISQPVASIDVSNALVFGHGWVRIVLDHTPLAKMLPPPDKPKVLSILGMDDLKTALEIINDAAATIPGVQLRVDTDGRVRARVEVEL
jgi:hypothetical protein